MFGNNVQSRLIAIRNEQRAQKTSSILSYGQLTKPDTTPTKTWAGIVKNAGSNDLAAHWIATFERSDGVNSTPIVNFPWKIEIGIGQYDDFIALGWLTSVRGRDKRAVDELNFTEGVYEVGLNYVKWFVSISGTSWNYGSSNGTTVNLTIQAVSMIKGELTLEKDM